MNVDGASSGFSMENIFIGFFYASDGDKMMKNKKNLIFLQKYAWLFPEIRYIVPHWNLWRLSSVGRAMES